MELNHQGPKTARLQRARPANAQRPHKIERTAGADVASQRRPFLDPLHLSKSGARVLRAAVVDRRQAEKEKPRLGWSPVGGLGRGLW